jgi:Rrf2 family protein
MKLQKASRYALYAVLHLASEPGKQFSTAEIAESYGVSIHHLAKVMRTLVRSGLIESVRGVGGGYRFTGSLRRTTLWDVIHEFARDARFDYVKDIAQVRRRKPGKE